VLDKPNDTPAAASWDRFDAAAAVFLAFTGLIDLAVTVLAIVTDSMDPWLRIASLLSGAVGAAVAIAAAAGLSTGRSWGRPLAKAVLVVVAIGGILGGIVDIASGRLPIPLWALLAIVILRLRPSSAAIRQARPVAPTPEAKPLGQPIWIGLAALTVSILVVPLVLYLRFPGNSPLSAAAGSVDIQASLACSPSDDPVDGVRPDRVEFAASWTWTQRELLPVGEDGIAYRWAIVDAAGHKAFVEGTLVLWNAPGTGYSATYGATGLDRVYPPPSAATGPFFLGTRGPTGSRLLALAQESTLNGDYVEPVMFDLARAGEGDGSYALGLRGGRLVNNGQLLPMLPEHGTITAGAGYVHLGQWTVWSQPASCSW
jgi:hypothetical protein